jgi:chromosome segregation ATPase
MAFAMFEYGQELRMAACFTSDDLEAVWQPLGHTVQGLRQEYRQFEQMTASFLTELDKLQESFLERAVACDTLEKELSRQQDQRLRLLSRYDQQEAQLTKALEQLAELRHTGENRVSDAAVASGTTTLEEQRYQLEIEQLRRELAESREEVTRLQRDNEELREERGRWVVELEYQQRENETLAAQRDQLEQQQHVQEQRINDELLSLQNLVQTLLKRSHAEPREKAAGAEDTHEGAATSNPRSGSAVAGSLQAQFERIKKDAERRRTRP